ncbi:hypothetical protein HYPBUDRAFT_136227 [Hyphopichia burtonii NRRL Y-1933]|uniref:Uncharacterized protein n=1 Tax=Hyphopichia burtonii NRRL Y-1933 TaxID=984485 RepID=A0A1E4RPB4_9ASCO|nr:hypothetical protein HYPBUDRAFT_136227 [Hyphopichia burtonii NRRL Y-1933]ODV69120.1 hypothetical protein HYPBUDRAFT_136227 [Hyphopichia burtonii NRRL Y-1933]
MKASLAFIIISYLSVTNALNILISSKDSWVSKNTRYLYQSLKEQNHSVILSAPLYHDPNSHQETNSPGKRSGATSTKDGGDFGHLLPVHQTYYKNNQKVSSLPKRAKNIIGKKDEEEFEAGIASTISTSSYGQDPLDHDIWYVNASPLNTLLITYDVLLPTYYPDFVPDLVILGPNEGLSLTDYNHPSDIFVDLEDHSYEDALESMIKLTQLKDFPVMAVSTEDNHHIYYQDEHFFKIQKPTLTESLKKKNAFAKNILFINEQISQLIDLLFSKTSISKNQISLNINFPSMNHDQSNCFTSVSKKSSKNPKYKQASSKIMKNHSKHTISIPNYILNHGEITSSGSYNITVDYPKDKDPKILLQTNLIDEPKSTFVDKRSYYYQQKVKLGSPSEIAKIENSIAKRNDENIELTQSISDNEELNSLINNNIEEINVLKNCGISVSIGHLSLSDGVSEDIFRLLDLFN